jgi:hypothetical protein
MAAEKFVITSNSGHSGPRAKNQEQVGKTATSAIILSASGV